MCRPTERRTRNGAAINCCDILFNSTSLFRHSYIGTTLDYDITYRQSEFNKIVSHAAAAAATNPSEKYKMWETVWPGPHISDSISLGGHYVCWTALADILQYMYVQVQCIGCCQMRKNSVQTIDVCALYIQRKNSNCICRALIPDPSTSRVLQSYIHLSSTQCRYKPGRA